MTHLEEVIWGSVYAHLMVGKLLGPPSPLAIETADKVVLNLRRYVTTCALHGVNRDLEEERLAGEEKGRFEVAPAPDTYAYAEWRRWKAINNGNSSPTTY